MRRIRQEDKIMLSIILVIIAGAIAYRLAITGTMPLKIRAELAKSANDMKERNQTMAYTDQAARSYDQGVEEGFRRAVSIVNKNLGDDDPKAKAE